MDTDKKELEVMDAEFVVIGEEVIPIRTPQSEPSSRLPAVPRPTVKDQLARVPAISQLPRWRDGHAGDVR